MTDHRKGTIVRRAETIRSMPAVCPAQPVQRRPAGVAGSWSSTANAPYTNMSVPLMLASYTTQQADYGPEGCRYGRPRLNDPLESFIVPHADVPKLNQQGAIILQFASDSSSPFFFCLLVPSMRIHLYSSHTQLPHRHFVTPRPSSKFIDQALVV